MLKKCTCCDVCNCLNLESSDNTITVEKNENCEVCSFDFRLSSNNIDNLLSFNSGSCISFTKEFIDGKLVITPVIDWSCISDNICGLCAGTAILGYIRNNETLFSSCTVDNTINSVLFNGLPPTILTGSLPLNGGGVGLTATFPPGTHTIVVNVSGSTNFVRFQDSAGTVTCQPFIGPGNYTVPGFVISSLGSWSVDTVCNPTCA